MTDDMATSSEDAEDETLTDAYSNAEKSEVRSVDPSSSTSSQHQAQASTLKRRRVTRACDECRRKKIKCDGRQPCTHCTVYSYDCTYDQPSHRRRNIGPQYVEALENRATRAERLLEIFAPHIDLEDPSLEDWINQRLSSGQIRSNTDPVDKFNKQALIAQQPLPTKEPDLESMVEATGQLGLDERGYWDYHGHSSGMNFLFRLRDELGEIIDPQRGEGERRRTQRPLKTAQGTPFAKPPQEFQDSPFEQRKVTSSDLPPQATAIALCNAVLDTHQTVVSILHRPTFDRRLERIFSKGSENYDDEDRHFLPLLLSVMALGCLLLDSEQSDLHLYGYQHATSEGYRYFWAARQFIDVTDCRDLVDLQAILFLTMFLQSSAKLATCFAYIGVALRAALRMGLHRSFRDNFGPIESEERKRTFWVIRKMDVFVAAMLGLPVTLSDEDIDQDFPTEVNDHYITTRGVGRMPPGEITNQSAANADFQITDIIIKIVRLIYPIKGFQDNDKRTPTTYSVSYSVIQSIESDLENWKKNLPDIFKPGNEAPGHVVRAQQLLRVTFAHAQMMLYRPFLHYVSNKFQSKKLDQRSYTCALACIAVSRNIVHLTVEMKRRGFLIGCQWFTMYTAFFAVLSLVFYAVENQSDAQSLNLMREAWEGKEVLASVAQRSMAADRCTVTLNKLFSKIDSNAENFGFLSPVATKNSPQLGLSKQPSRSHGDLPLTRKTEASVPTRSHTFPPNRRPNEQKYQASKKRASKPTGLQIPPRPQVPTTMYSTVPLDTVAQQQHSQSFDSSSSQQQPVHDLRYSQPQQSSFQYTGRPENLATTTFPSQDPFAYPKQPITSLAQSGSNPYVPSFVQGGPFLPSNVSKQLSTTPDDHIDVRLLGPLPPYGVHGQQQPGSYPMANVQHQTHDRAHDTLPSQMWEDPARSHGLGMDLDAIFGGEEWRGGFQPAVGQWDRTGNWQTHHSNQ